MPVTLRTILTAVEPQAAAHARVETDPRILYITADSRQVQPGSLFVAVPGEQVDGHRYIGGALAQGAVAVLGEWPEARVRGELNGAYAEIPYIQVARARLALAHACAALYDFPSRALTVVGVTGTDGKTTTCTLIESILQAHTHSPQNPDSTVGVVTTVGARIRGRELDTGFHVTTPDAPEVQQFLAEMRDAGCTHAVVESTSHGLDQGRVAAVDFDVAAVTNITHEHLDYHGTRAAYVAAKALLFRALAHSPLKPGVSRCAVLNRDDEGSFGALQRALDEEAAAGHTVAVRTYGIRTRSDATRNTVADSPVDFTATQDTAQDTATQCDVWAHRIEYFPDRTEVTLRWWGGEFTLRSRLIGEFNVYNMLCAATVALGLGIAPGTVQQGIEAVEGVIGRMERIDEGQPFLAVVDFAHSPVSLERALHTLRPLTAERVDGSPGRVIAVFGSAGLRDRAKRRLMGAVGGRLADFTVVTAEDPRTESLAAINREIELGLLEAEAAGRYTIVEDRAAAMRVAVEMAQPGDVVAAFGKGHERSMCFGTVEYPWSDQDALRTALQQRPLDAAHR